MTFLIIAWVACSVSFVLGAMWASGSGEPHALAARACEWLTNATIRGVGASSGSSGTSMSNVADSYRCPECGAEREFTAIRKMTLTDSGERGYDEITLPWCGNGHDPTVMYGPGFPAPRPKVLADE